MNEMPPVEQPEVKDPDLGDVLDAIKELTKAQGDNTKVLGELKEAQEELSKQIELSRKAGKF